MSKASGAVNVERIITKTVNEAANRLELVVNKAFAVGYEKGKSEVPNKFNKTQDRLKAYPHLKDNIRKYQEDIDDLKQYGVPGKSKDLVFYATIASGTRLTAEDVEQARILVLEKKLLRDQVEIEEIDWALKAIESDYYYQIIKLKYFESKDDETIGELLQCDARTIRRHKNRLINVIALKLYGAESL